MCTETDSAEACGMGEENHDAFLSHSSVYMTDLRLSQRENETVWFLSHTHSSYTQLASMRLSYIENDISQTSLFVFWFSVDAYAHISLCSYGCRSVSALGVFVYGCVWTAVSSRLMFPCSLYGRSLMIGKALCFPTSWPIRVGPFWQLKWNAPGCSFLQRDYSDWLILDQWMCVLWPLKHIPVSSCL